MIIRIEEIQSACSKILSAVDANTLSAVTETLQLDAHDQVLYISVTNREYYVQVRIPVDIDEKLFATVQANLFLKLVSQITTETIELSVNTTTLLIKGNGTYKLPLIFDNDKLLVLPEIVINNPSVEMSVDSSILNSILQFNSKELSKGVISRPIQKLYYVDEHGAITFTTGACVNSFSLATPIKMLLNDRLVKLFKLFKQGSVAVTFGHDPISQDIIQTKVKFESKDTTLTAILSCDDTMLNSFPVNAVRERASVTYPYSVNISKESLIQTISRLLLFSSSTTSRDIVRPYSTFQFKKDSVVVYDTKKENKEEVSYTNSEASIEDCYEAILDFNDLKLTLESCAEQYVTFQFGDNTAVVLSRGNVKNIIPECDGE